MTDLLFNGVSVFDVLEAQTRAIEKAIQDLDPNYLLNVSENDLVSSLVREYRLEVPQLKEDDIHVANYGETPVDVSGDFRGAIFDRGRPFYIQGTETTIAVPFEGDAAFFQVQPQSYSLNPPRGTVAGSELHLTYVRTNQDAEALKRDYMSALSQIKTNLESLRSSASGFNDGLEALVRQRVTARKAKLLSDAGMVAGLGLPIKRRAGAATTYAVPVQRRRPRIERPSAPSSAFSPEPVLAKEDYDAILAIMHNMVTVMELSPHAFEYMKEEDLRNHFLVQLNAQYEGQATGETFNFQGKTDILIRAEGQNAFIAECKFWKGEKRFLETVDQLLSYLSWRDTKTAILVFNRASEFTEVLNKIVAAVPSHPCFKRALGTTNESTFRYVFHQPNDPNRELLLTVMTFDIPTAPKELPAGHVEYS